MAKLMQGTSLYLGFLGRKGGNEEFLEEEFLRRKTLEEKEELTSLKKAIFWFIALEKREVPRYIQFLCIDIGTYLYIPI